MDDYAQYVDKPNDSALARIAELAEKQVAAEKIIADLTAKLAYANLALKAIRENDLPDAMSEAGCASYTLTDGSIVKVKRDWAISINKDFHGAALQWLTENNLGGIIKNAINVQFGRDNDAEARALVDEIKDAHPTADVEIKKTVHAQTLKATLKAELAKQTAVPNDLFHLYPLRWSEVKVPQAGRGF